MKGMEILVTKNYPITQNKETASRHTAECETLYLMFAQIEGNLDSAVMFCSDALSQ